MNLKKSAVYLVFMITLCEIISTSSVMGASSASPGGFEIARPPSQKDWQWFLSLSVVERDAMWDDFVTEGKQLTDWNWAWQVGWGRSCEADWSSICPNILNSLLQSKALLLQAAGGSLLVMQYGQRFPVKVFKRLQKLLANTELKPLYRYLQRKLLQQMSALRIHNQGAWIQVRSTLSRELQVYHDYLTRIPPVVGTVAKPQVKRPWQAKEKPL